MGRKIAEVDLTHFCDTTCSRYPLEAPWTFGDWTYATDGRICVRVPANGLPDSAPPKGKKYPSAYELFDNFADVTCDKLWPKTPFTPDNPCPTCFGSGWSQRKCPICKGSGKCKCPQCEDEHPCGRCHGHGTVDDSMEVCPTCVTMLDDVMLLGQWVMLVWRFCGRGVKWGTWPDDSDRVAFVGRGGLQGIVAGIAK